MAYNDFSAESPTNYEQKCCCIMALDVSGSMSGQPIKQLNDGLTSFYQDIRGDSNTANKLEVGIITFGSDILCIQEPALAAQFSIPTLASNGSTKLVDGVREAIQKVETRKQWYKSTGQPYFRPWVILITDGAPDSDQDVDGLAREIQAGVRDKKFYFFAIGVENADMVMLQRISSPDMPPAKMQGLKFSAFFKWLSASMTAITSSTEGDKVNLAGNAADWMQGFQI